MLPIARFQCEKLVLLGDPKQLDPTIQGSEAAHSYGLEQTLFNRLIHQARVKLIFSITALFSVCIKCIELFSD